MAHSLQFSLSISSAFSRRPSKEVGPKPYSYAQAVRPISAVHSAIVSPPSKTSISNEETLAIAPSPVPQHLPAVIELDKVTEAELKEDGARSSRRTKLVCTIGPVTCGFAELEALAAGGMNVARINMCHGTREWHRGVVERVRRLNEERGYAVAIMMDTEGSELRMGDLAGATSAKAQDGDIWTFSVRSFHSPLPAQTVSVNYDGFAEDVKLGDEIVVDGGMARFEVVDKIGPDVKCCCTDSGLLLPCANLTLWRDGRLLQGRNAMLPTISSKDWLDIDFGLAVGVDFIAVSFVKSAEVINHLRSYIAARSPDSDVAIIAKIESLESMKNLEEIIRSSDGVMVARGDLGAQIPLELVPSAQSKIVNLCRQLKKPVIVASQLLESMIEYPIPTRAEVADVSEAVMQQADALMLSGESAMGRYPDKALSVLRSISLRIEKRLREEKCDGIMKVLDVSSVLFPGSSIQEELCSAAANMANDLGADAIFVHTKTGKMASLLSSFRPKCPIFAFTQSASVRRRLSLQWGIVPFNLNLSDNEDSHLDRTFALMKARGLIEPGHTIVSVSDSLQSIQVVYFPPNP